MDRLRIVTSDHLDPLLEHLALRLEREPLAPWLDEVVVVQSHGMARWLRLQLARRTGIAAALHVPFPGPWARELARQLGVEGAEDGDDDPFDPTSTTWRLHEIFATLGPGPDALDPVRLYVQDDEDGLKRYQLAARVAGLFHQYQLHRPELLLDWREARGDEDGDAAWQAELWRRLSGGVDARALSDVLLDLRRCLRESRFDPARLPSRVSFFGVPTLAPLLVETIDALSAHVECALYVVSPTPEYWSDLRSESELERLRLRDDVDAELEHLEVAHPLLGSMGRQGREFLALLQEIDRTGQAHEGLEGRVPEATTLLGRLQRDIRDLRRPEDEAPLSVGRDDRSLRVHVCHSPMREMEVLREEILRAFEDGVVREPGDVLLLVPDIAAYAPYVQAVFGRRAPTEDGAWLHLPFGLADRHPGDEQPFARTALQLLRLAGGRRGLGEVFDLLEQEVVARRFALDPGELPSLRERVREAGVRWGADPQQRARDADVPAFEGATWREGLDRLLLGVLTGPREDMVAGRLPLGDGTWSRTARLAALREAVGRVFHHLDRLREDQPLRDWARRLRHALLDVCEANDENEQEWQRDVLEALQRLDDRAERFALAAPTGRSAFLEALEVELGEAAGDRGFISGAITVAELRPMRSLPFPLILVAGLEDQVFPRLDRPDSFDLMAQNRRAGDRRASDDDRYLFLETLLAAERRLALSYVGRSQHDNRELGRSVCVDELLDVVDRCSVGPDAEGGSKRVVVEHALQPTDPRVLDPAFPEAFTYDADWAQAIRARTLGPRPLPEFVAPDFEAPPAEPAGEATTDIALEDLLEFWRSPSEWFCRRVLGMKLHTAEDDEEDRETFDLPALDAWRVHDWLHDRRRQGRAPDAGEREVLHARWGLPLGESGRLLARDLQEQSVERWNALHEGCEARDPLVFSLPGPGWTLHGRLAPASTRGLLHLSAGKLRAKNRLAVWIQHLALLALDDGSREDVPSRSILAARDHVVQFGATEDALARLDELVQGLREGTRRPLPFHPDTSEAFAAETEPGPPVEVFRRAKVQTAWCGNDHVAGDRTRDAVDLLTRGLDEPAIATEAFATWARTVWTPLEAAQSKWKGDDA